MSLILTGNSSSLTIDSTNGVTFPNATQQASAGVILQVIYGTNATSISTTSTSFSDIGLTASITPKFSTSKILVLANINNYALRAGSDCAGAIQLLRGNSAVWTQATSGASNGPGFYLYAQGCGTTNLGGIQMINYVDSPATTSLTTYKVQHAAFSGTMYSQYGNTTSTITLMEIAS